MKSKIKNDKFRFLMDIFNGTILSFYKICKMRKKKKKGYSLYDMLHDVFVIVSNIFQG